MIAVSEAKPNQRVSYFGKAAPRVRPPQQKRRLAIRTLKIGLPLIALALLAFGLAGPYLRPGLDQLTALLPIAVERSSDDYHVIKITMRGVTKSDRPFMFTAETAAKIDADAGPVELVRPNADMTLEDGSWIAVMAERGVYTPDTKTITLLDDVNVFHDQGYELNTSHAVVHLDDARAESDRPVRGHGSFGTIDGQGFRIVDDGRRIEVIGPARLVIYGAGAGLQ